MKSRLKQVAFAGLLMTATGANAAPVDLTTWSALTLNFPGGQNAGNWVLEPGNTAVNQTVNADPSFYLNNLNQTAYSMQGSWQVTNAAGDNDFMGFAFGYQNSSNFYLFDWKAANQSSGGVFAAEGMSIKKYAGATGNGLVDLSIDEFWGNAAPLGDMTVLATNHSTSAGWAVGTLYDFLLDFNLTPGTLHVSVKQGATTLWDQTVVDTSFTSGQFAFYNNSQANVRYAGFEQEGGVIVDPPPTSVPEPDSLALIGLGLLTIAAARRRKTA